MQCFLIPFYCLIVGLVDPGPVTEGNDKRSVYGDTKNVNSYHRITKDVVVAPSFSDSRASESIVHKSEAVINGAKCPLTTKTAPKPKPKPKPSVPHPSFDSKTYIHKYQRTEKQKPENNTPSTQSLSGSEFERQDQQAKASSLQQCRSVNIREQHNTYFQPEPSLHHASDAIEEQRTWKFDDLEIVPPPPIMQADVCVCDNDEFLDLVVPPPFFAGESFSDAPLVDKLTTDIIEDISQADIRLVEGESQNTRELLFSDSVATGIINHSEKQNNLSIVSNGDILPPFIPDVGSLESVSGDPPTPVSEPPFVTDFCDELNKEDGMANNESLPSPPKWESQSHADVLLGNTTPAAAVTHSPEGETTAMLDFSDLGVYIVPPPPPTDES